MRFERDGVGLKLNRFRFLWLLLLAALILALLETPWVSIAHRQAGTRAFLRAASRSQLSSADPGWPITVEAEMLAPAAWHLQQANGEPDTQPRALNTYRTLGAVKLAANNPIGGQQLLRRRLELAPTDVLASFFLGEAYLRLGNTQAAIKHWGAAGARHQLMRLAKELAEREAWDEALAALDVVRRLDATDLNSRWRAAEIWRMQANTARALGLAQEIIAIAPEDPIGYELSSRALFDAGQYEYAITFMEQALARDLDRPHFTLRRLGKAYAALGQWPEAIEAYEKAIREDPTRYPDYVLMADAKCQVGRPAEARTYYEQAMALGSKQDRVRKAVEHIAEHRGCPP